MNIIINCLEQSILDFSQFSLQLFKENQRLESFTLSLITSHQIIKGQKGITFKNLNLSSIKILENDCVMQYYDSFIYKQLIRICNNEDTIQKLSLFLPVQPPQLIFPEDHPYIYELNHIIKKQPLFIYLNQEQYKKEFIELYKNTHWIFSRKNIETDIQQFIGNYLQKKLYAIALNKELSPSCPSFCSKHIKI